jgi:arylsulfatase A-like enzyme
MPSDRFSRRQAIAGAGALAGAALARPASAAPARQPNILYIMADDMGYADLSCYGRRDYQTPRLDRLARQGMRFTDAYANSAVCTATRVGLITGRYQYRLPIGLEEPLQERPLGLPPAHPTMPSLLRKAGYLTSLVGKWHLGSLPNYGPLKSGYDHFWGLRGGGVDYFTHKLGDFSDLWDGDTPVEKAGYLTDLLADRAIIELERAKAAAKPFFMSLHFTAPHWPWEAPGDEAEAARLAKAGGGVAAILHFDGGTHATYAAMVTRLDYQIGRVLDRLKALGMERDTIVVFTSDNGGERFSDTWPFSGKKTELLEGGIRVPAIVRWPGRVRAGTVSDAQIISMDWMPTFLAVGGGSADPAYPLDGIDITAALMGGKLPERPLFWRYKAHAQQAVLRGDWKYLKIAGNSFLFNVAADPLERANLKKREPQRYAELEALWQQWNTGMLPFDPLSSTHGITADTQADHIGATLPPPAAGR